MATRTVLWFKGYPVSIKAVWGVNHVDAILTLRLSSDRDRQYIYIFSGIYFYKFNHNRVQIGERSEIENDWGVSGPIDAAFQWSKNGKTYLIKGDTYEYIPLSRSLGYYFFKTKYRGNADIIRTVAHCRLWILSLLERETVVVWWGIPASHFRLQQEDQLRQRCISKHRGKNILLPIDVVLHLQRHHQRCKSFFFLVQHPVKGVLRISGAMQ